MGLVGESGCGKSTLTRALLGLDPVQAGTITLDGAPVFAKNQPNLAVRRKMQVVFQDPFGSFNPRHRVDRLITEPFHLLTSPPTGAARTKAIDAALTAVGLTPQDARKYIHEFSGGQRQRLSLARALLKDPPILVLDEATSAVDNETEAAIQRSLKRIGHNRTVIMIAHRLSTIVDADTIAVVDGGRIVESGRHEDLLESNGAYTAQWRVQTGQA